MLPRGNFILHNPMERISGLSDFQKVLKSSSEKNFLALFLRELSLQKTFIFFWRRAEKISCDSLEISPKSESFMANQ